MSKDNTVADTPTAEQLAEAKPGLSDEEKAALAAEDDAGDGNADADKAAAAKDPPQDAAAADSTDAAVAGSTDDAAAAEQPAEIPRGASANVELLATRDIDLRAIKDRLEQIDTVQSELDEQFDGEKIETKDYLSKSRALTQEQADLNADIREAHFVQNANKSLASTDWQRSVNAFVDNNSQFASTIMQGALNAALSELYGDDKNIGSSHNWYLQTAKRAVLEQISPAAAAKENPPDADPNADAVKAAKAAADSANDAKGKLPKTLGDVPAADAAETGKGKFDDLDSLEGVELEAKLSLMTPEQEQEYLRAD